MQITTIGLDIAKNVFQVHGIDEAEKVIIRKQLRRGQLLAFFEALAPCLVGMEACATSHYWARELTKLGHEVRLMPAKDVRAYVKRNKNDAADAEAICEAVRRPTMRFVRNKSAELPSRPSSRTRRHSGRVVILRPGSGSCRGKIRPAANRSSGQSQNKATNTSGAFLLSEPILCCGARVSSRRSIPGSLSFSLGDRSRSSRWRWPTRWRGSPGRCWPGVGPTGRLNWWQPDKELGNGRMRLRPCVHELQGRRRH
jgi:hypothetical protein